MTSTSVANFSEFSKDQRPKRVFYAGKQSDGLGVFFHQEIQDYAIFVLKFVVTREQSKDDASKDDGRPRREPRAPARTRLGSAHGAIAQALTTSEGHAYSTIPEPCDDCGARHTVKRVRP